MLLFLMGVDLPTILLLVLLLLVFGRLIFWLTTKLLRRALKDTSDEKVKILSRVSAFILSPVIVIGSLVLFIFISIQTAPQESDEEMTKNHYEMMEEDIREDVGEYKYSVTHNVQADRIPGIMEFGLIIDVKD